jgi:phosphatidylethanolamine-binding protein (PEBP) family uncharacterized protein
MRFGGPPRASCRSVNGGAQRDVFRVAALDARLEDLAAGATAREVDEAVGGRLLAGDELVGTFER